MMTWTFLLLAGLATAQEAPPPGAEDAPAAESPADQDWSKRAPAEVEPGSKRVVYAVQEGDTVESIAASQGFLAADIRRWNRLATGKVIPGTEIVMWVAPIETEPVIDVAEGDPKKGGGAKAGGKGGGGGGAKGGGDDRDGVGFFAGLSVGPAFSLSPLKAAVSPRVELGIELPPVDRSFRIFVSGQYMRPKAEGEVQDDRVPSGTFTYDVTQDELSIATGLAFRAGMLDSIVKPEVAVGPNIFMYRSTANGSAGNANFPESTEQYTRVGIYAAGGVGVELGPGELTALLMFQSSAFNAVITGQANSAALAPMIGYRFVF